MITHTGLYGDAVFLEFSEEGVRQRERPSMTNGNLLFLPISQSEWFAAELAWEFGV